LSGNTKNNLNKSMDIGVSASFYASPIKSPIFFHKNLIKEEISNNQRDLSALHGEKSRIFWDEQREVNFNKISS
jgi:hypothetical protein